MLSRFEVINKKVKYFFVANYSKIKEINERYAKPKIQMTLTVKIALLFLQLYLLFLIGLLGYKFYTLIN